MLPTHSTLLASLLLLTLSAAGRSKEQRSEPTTRPNIVLVMSDDQGYGDFGFLGNPSIQTPELDRLAETSTWMSTFYVTPVCSSTRASLLTGRYHQRTGVKRNGLPLNPEEVTLAEHLRAAGYATAIFGKWHLGRHYPRRPADQGFDEVLSFRGGVLREFEPEPARVRYVNPTLEHNGVISQHQGFATDIFFDAALKWIELQKAAQKPFFAYLSCAAPHGPWDEAPESTRALYSRATQEQLGDKNTRIYSLITKLDQNIGKLMARLRELELLANTLVIFLSDNGPMGVDQQRFMAGLKGHKGDILEGGVMTPLIVHWEGVLKPRRIQKTFGSVIDLVPSLLDICDLEPGKVDLDGRSLWPLWRGEEQAVVQRTLILQAHNSGSLSLNFAVRTNRWKLTNPSGLKGAERGNRTQFYLHDMHADPTEKVNLRKQRKKVFKDLNTFYLSWAKNIRAEDPSEPSEPPVWIGNGVEEPVLLSKRFDLQQSLSEWWLDVREQANFDLELRFLPLAKGTQAKLILERFEDPQADQPTQTITLSAKPTAGAKSCPLPTQTITPGLWKLRAELWTANGLVQGEASVWQVLVSQTK